MSGTPWPPITYGGSTSRPSIALVAEPEVDPGASIGALVKDATAQVSTLVRAEIELAKLEVTASVKTALTGAVFFILAGVIALFSAFFFWIMVGEILTIWLPRWLSFTIVFAAMIVMAGGLAFLGIKKVKKIKKPARTISSLSETASTLKSAAKHSEQPAVR